jgi:hypothetical protein
MMRRLIFAIGFIATLMISCDDDSNDDKKADDKTATVRATAINGQWRVTSYSDNGTNETSNFNGYIFTFDSGNNIVASNGTNNYSGNWSVTDSNSADDNNEKLEDVDFNISFTPPPAFEELTEKWEIISLAETKIELRHVSGGNGGTDLLTFEKV